MKISTRSIQFRLTVWYAAILTAGLALFGTLIWISMRHRLISDIDNDLQGRALRLKDYFLVESAETRGAHLRSELEEFCAALPPTSYVSLTGSDGFEFRYPRNGTPGGAARMRAVHHEFSAAGITYQLEMRTSLSDVHHTLDLLRLLLWSLLPLVIGIACAGGAWLSTRALRPVRDITDAALTVSIENLSGRLPVPNTGDEIARLAEVLNHMLERLESAVKTLSQFAADASHELRTPIAVVRTTAELALRRIRTPDSYRQSLHDIAAEAERMTRLVEDLLILARRDAGTEDLPLSSVDLRDVVTDVLAETRSLAEMSGIRIHATLGNSGAVISGNRPALHRLLLVLVDNALKYSPAESEVNIMIEHADSRVQVVVKDFGTGISEADLPHIFQRFYRADPARTGPGHGLGLALADTIARAHGAFIEVESALSVGSTFRIVFPSRGEYLDPVKSAVSAAP